MPSGRATDRPGLLTDMYHPDSAYVSWRAGLNGQTTFELFARRAPFGGSYLLVAGLEAALDFIRAFRYTDDDLAFLDQIRDYEPEFLEELRRLRFTGEVWAAYLILGGIFVIAGAFVWTLRSPRNEDANA